MYVKNMMVKDLVVATSNQTISEVLDLMVLNEIHRIPVVQDQRLIGLITEAIVLENSPSNASSLSIHELNYLLSKTTIAEIMIKDVITIDPDALIEMAALKMAEHDIGCLPVVNEKQVLLGLITNNTILRAFTEMMGLNEPGSRLVVEFQEDKPGILADLARVFADQMINLTHLAVHREVDRIDVVVRCNHHDHQFLLDLLKKHGYKVTSII